MYQKGTLMLKVAVLTLVPKTFATLIKPEVVPGISTNTQIPGIEIYIKLKNKYNIYKLY